MSTLDARGWRRSRWLNHLQTLALMSVLFGLLAMIGWLLWGLDGVIVLVGGTLLALVFAPRISPRWLMRLHGAVPLPVERVPTLNAALIELSSRAGLPSVPALYYLPSSLINAFAVGTPARSGIAVTDGMLRRLDVREAIGVLAHEVSHVRANDLRVMALADLLGRMTALMAWVGLLLLFLSLPLWWLTGVAVNWLLLPLLLLAPLLSLLAQLGLSRLREYHADLQAARLTGDPEGLARALLKIERLQGGWMERLLMPSRLPMPDWLRTHPPTHARLAENPSAHRRARAASDGPARQAPADSPASSFTGAAGYRAGDRAATPARQRPVVLSASTTCPSISASPTLPSAGFCGAAPGCATIDPFPSSLP